MINSLHQNMAQQQPRYPAGELHHQHQHQQQPYDQGSLRVYQKQQYHPYQHPHPQQHQMPEPLQPQMMQQPPYPHGGLKQETYTQPYPPRAMPPPQPPPSATTDSDVNFPTTFTMSKKYGKYAFTLVVQQQPQRARMCGFGDKDRRPITPPPIIRLHIYDETGQDIDYDMEIDSGKLILGAGIWDVTAMKDENYVNYPTKDGPGPIVPLPRTHQYNGPRPSLPSTPEVDIRQYQAYQDTYGGTSAYPTVESPNTHQAIPIPEPLTSRFNRDSVVCANLIGQHYCSAQQLTGLDNETGLYFTLPDLSVRTEGDFRLKFSCMIVGVLGLPDEPTDYPQMPLGGMYKYAPCIAELFSEPFRVYSAKKFPGVIDSTLWSKKMAEQGVKIPIRDSEKKNGKGGKEDDDAEDGEEDDALQEDMQSVRD